MDKKEPTQLGHKPTSFFINGQGIEKIFNSLQFLEVIVQRGSIGKIEYEKCIPISRVL